MQPITISTNPTPDQVKAILAAGPGATVHHPFAGNGGRKKQLEQSLARAGVPYQVVRSLGWSSTGRDAKPEPPAMSSLIELDLRARGIEPAGVYQLAKTNEQLATEMLRSLLPFANVDVEDEVVAATWDSLDGVELRYAIAFETTDDG